MAGNEGADLPLPDDLLKETEDEVLEILDEDGDEEEAIRVEEEPVEEVLEEESKLADLEARYGDETDRIRQEAQAEINRYRRGYYEVQVQAADVIIGGIQERIRLTTDALVKAKEDADHVTEVKAQATLVELQKQQDIAINAKNTATERANQPAPQPQRQEQPARPHPLATRFMQHNAWISDPKNRPIQQYMLAVDRELLTNGSNPNTAEYYNEVAKRLQQAFPKMPVKAVDGRAMGARPRQQQPGRSPATGNRQTAVLTTQRERAQGPTPTFTSDDLKLYRKMGIDVTDPKTVKELKAVRSARIAKGD